MARVGPDAAAVGKTTGDDVRYAGHRLFYELVPAHPLPDLDLSLSLKSRYFSPRALQFINQSIAPYNALIFTAYLVAVVGYPIFLVLDLSTSRKLSIIVTVLALPATLLAPLHLRYHVVRLLISSTYEVWFFSVINAITFVVCGMVLNDIRCLVIFTPWLGMQINIVLDANLRSVRRFVVASILASVMLLMIILFVTFDWVPGVRNLVLWRYNTHEISAFAVILNGITTLIAMVARNVFRNRRNLSKSPGAHLSVVSCVAYRCTLRFVAVDQAIVQNPAFAARLHRQPGEDESSAVADSQSSMHRPTHMQQMRYIATVQILDSEATVIAYRLLTRLDRALKTRHVVWWMSRIGIALTLAATPLDVVLNKSDDLNRDGVVPWGHFLALAATLIFFFVCAAHYQRLLLQSIVMSFDFAFLDIQSFFVHLAMCDFFRWKSRAVSLVALSWIWTHWILLADALTPRARRMLGLNVHIFAHVTGFCMGMSILVLYLMIFSDYSTELYDRVLFSKTFMTHVFEIRVSPIFYSCYITLLAWFVKLFWRVCTCAAHDLILVDGEIEYDNYLRKTRTRHQSLPWFLARNRVEPGTEDDCVDAPSSQT